jgi:hypothetical protein
VKGSSRQVTAIALNVSHLQDKPEFKGGLARQKYAWSAIRKLFRNGLLGSSCSSVNTAMLLRLVG